MGESPTALQIDLLKPHLQALLDEAKRVGPEAARAASNEAEAKLPEKLRAEAKEKLRAAANSSDSPSCAGLHVLAAVARELAFDAAAEGDLDASIQYAFESYNYESAASAQGCD